MLPELFARRMQNLLKEEYPLFEQSYQEHPFQALRLNPLKGDSGRFLELSPFHLTPVSFAQNGYYYGNEDRPGKHPYHEAGVYYMQEASAMVPAEYLQAMPGEKVLDLCAAPGGKSTQLAAAMQGKGILFCNEIHPARAGILSENIERMGIVNAIVISHSPDFLSARFPGYFDRILVDAPCSGEGMFRRNEEAVKEWSPENVQMCAKRQDEILEHAAVMLAGGGRMVYSTCTFAPEENEGSISRFLKRHPEFTLAAVEKKAGFAAGNPDFVEDAAEGIENTIRLWPHRLKGEGHFAAVLQKDEETGREKGKREVTETGIAPKEYADYLSFEKDCLKKQAKGTFVRFGEQLYLLPEGTPSLSKIKVLRPGLHLGTLKKNRFTPSHALALSLKPEEVQRCSEIPAAGPLVKKYLGGQTLEADLENGFCLMTTDGYSLGWGKAVDGIIKNHYPKGLRKNW